MHGNSSPLDTVTEQTKQLRADALWAAFMAQAEMEEKQLRHLKQVREKHLARERAATWRNAAQLVETMAEHGAFE